MRTIPDFTYTEKRHRWGFRNKETGVLKDWHDGDADLYFTRSDARAQRDRLEIKGHSVVKVYITFEIHSQ